MTISPFMQRNQSAFALLKQKLSTQTLSTQTTILGKDTTPPEKPQAAISSNGTSIRGKTEAFASVEIDINKDGSVDKTVQADSQGIFAAVLPEGSIKNGASVSVTAVDTAKNKSQPVDLVANIKPTSGEPVVDGITIKTHPEHGQYIDAADFGVDITGATDSQVTMMAALKFASEHNLAVRIEGKIHLKDQIVLSEAKGTSNVTAIFGEGMGVTTITYDKAQTGVFNPNTNTTDVREFSAILLDKVDGMKLKNFSLEYTRDDFYREGQSYFGKVNGIQVNDSDNTIIDAVEVSKFNRSGVFFSSRAALEVDPESRTGKTYHKAFFDGDVDYGYENLPYGENNKVINSNLHHNRVSGIMIAYQNNILIDNNDLARNGHENDGGTGYGVATSAGSYNDGVTYTNNRTDHNYRKGLDVHDGNNIVIENNTSTGDRLFGIAVYNRQFSMDKVRIENNSVTQDPAFRVSSDDDLGDKYYTGYTGIQIMTNTQGLDLHSADTGSYTIRNNTINGLQAYTDVRQATYGIEFRSNEPNMTYNLEIVDNNISGISSAYAVAVINNTFNNQTKENGVGSGNINISDNTVNFETTTGRGVPFYVEEKSAVSEHNGFVTIANNEVSISKSSGGWTEFTEVVSNAKNINITDNSINLNGSVEKPIFSILGKGDGTAMALVANNTITTDNPITAAKMISSSKVVLSDNGNEYNTPAAGIGYDFDSAENIPMSFNNADVSGEFEVTGDKRELASVFDETSFDTAGLKEAASYGSALVTESSTFTDNTESFVS